MQEQAISLDEVDQNGNSAVHVAAQYGQLGCLQVSLVCCFCIVVDVSINALENYV